MGEAENEDRRTVRVRDGMFCSSTGDSQILQRFNDVGIPGCSVLRRGKLQHQTTSKDKN